MAIKVGGTTVVDDSRGLTNIATVDATTAAAISASGVGGGSSHSAVASGSLSDGSTVVVNSDGTVSVVASTSLSSPSLSDVDEFPVGIASVEQALYDPTTKKVIFRMGNDVIVGQVSGTSISFGTEDSLPSSSSEAAIAYDPSSEKILIVYTNTSSSYRGEARVGTISGTSITLGGATSFTSNSALRSKVVYDDQAQKFVVSYIHQGDNGRFKARVATISGTSVSFGTEATINSGNNQGASDLLYDSTNNKIIAAVSGNYTDIAVGVGTVSGTSISFGSNTSITGDGAHEIAFSEHLANQKIIIAYRDAFNSSYGTASVGTVSGTSISFGTPVIFNSYSISKLANTYDESSQRVILAYDNNSNTGDVVMGTVTGTSISFSTPVSFFASRVNPVASFYYPSLTSVFLIYGNAADGDPADYLLVSTTGSNVTENNFIGFSDGAYSSGETATIQLVGSVDDAQTGLTAGQKHYVKGDGTLSSEPSIPSVYAGLAVSSTEIIIKG